MKRTLAAGVIAIVGCAPEAPPPFGEVVVVVDTDLAVPRVVDRLRIDLYAEDGTWFDHRDLPLPDPRDWPASFSVYNDDESLSKTVFARLRVYDGGAERPYLGERFAPRNAVVAPPPTEGPRLFIADAEVTPQTEPSPLVSVDRLVRVDVAPAVQGRAIAVLRASCAGRMSQLSSTPPHDRLADDATTCVDGEREAVQPLPIEVGSRQTPPSAWVNQLAPVRCEGDAVRACIPGGATVLGLRELLFVPAGVEAPTPERLVVHRPFLLDRYEMTVGRLREAVAAGFDWNGKVAPNDGDFDPIAIDVTGCTWSAQDRGREDYAINCVDWPGARAICQFFGGDLPTEAQWEHAATLAAEDARSRYPWGNEEPSCDRAVYARRDGPSGAACIDVGSGQLPVGAGAGDVTMQGVHDLAGGVQEWTLDSFAAFADSCWADSTVHDPRCELGQDSERTLRGGSWAAPPPFLLSSTRYFLEPGLAATLFGFRCAYPVAEP